MISWNWKLASSILRFFPNETVERPRLALEAYNNLCASNLEITRYFKIIYTLPTTGKCHYDAFPCTNINRSHLLYKIMHFIIIVWTTSIIHSSPYAICFPDCCSCRPVFQPLPCGRWAHKHVGWMVSFIHLFHLSTFSPFFRSDPFILLRFFPWRTRWFYFKFRILEF